MTTNKLLFGSIALLGLAGIVFTGAAIYLAPKYGQATAGASQMSEFVEPGSVPIGGPFTLVDHTGEIVTEDDFKGKYLLVFFGFTYCPDICPTTLSEIARTMEMLGEDAAAVQPLFISVDPQRDTPEVLAEYVAAFHPTIVGLTGTPDQIADVAESYRTYYEAMPAEEGQAGGAAESSGAGDYAVNHQGNTYLMSPDGEYLRHFSYGTSPEDMAASIRRAISKYGNPSQEEA